MSHEFDRNCCDSAPGVCVCDNTPDVPRCDFCSKEVDSETDLSLHDRDMLCAPCLAEAQASDAEWAAREREAVEQGRREMEAS